MRFLKYSIALLSLALSTSSFASKTSNADNDYGSKAYEADGNILVKFRGFGIITKGKPGSLPTPTSTRKDTDGTTDVNRTTSNISSLAKNGYGIENANTLFFSDHFASELSIGLAAYIFPRSGLNAIYNNYGATVTTPSTKKHLLMGIPLNLTLQYHIAPFGAIRPYVGAGYNYTYFTSKASEYKITPGQGMVLQAGVDIVMTDDTLISFDVKRISLSPKVTYKSSFLGASSVSTKVKMDPIIISLGMGFKL